MKKDNTLRFSLSKKQRALLIIGLMLIIAGMSVLLLYGLRKMKNEIEKNKIGFTMDKRWIYILIIV